MLFSFVITLSSRRDHINYQSVITLSTRDFYSQFVWLVPPIGVEVTYLTPFVITTASFWRRHHIIDSFVITLSSRRDHINYQSVITLSTRDFYSQFVWLVPPIGVKVTYLSSQA